MDKAHNGMSEDAHSTAQYRQQTDLDELLAISALNPIARLSCLADILSMRQTNLERQLGEVDTGKEAMSHHDRAQSGSAEETDGRDEGFSTRPEDFRSFVNRVPQNQDSDYDTGYETGSLRSSTPTSSLAPSIPSEYGTAAEWPLGREQQPERDSQEQAQHEPEWASEQSKQFESIVNDIIEAHYQVVEKQAEEIYRLTNVASQLDVEFRQFAEEERIKIKDSTDRVDGLLEMQKITERQLRRAEDTVEVNHSFSERVTQLGSNLHDANAESRRLKELLERDDQNLNHALRKVDSLDKMYTCAIEVKKQLEAKVGRKDAIIVLREQVDAQTIVIASLKDELRARADESRMLRIQRDRCIEMCEEQIKNFEKL